MCLESPSLLSFKVSLVERLVECNVCTLVKTLLTDAKKINRSKILFKTTTTLTATRTAVTSVTTTIIRTTSATNPRFQTNFAGVCVKRFHRRIQFKEKSSFRKKSRIFNWNVDGTALIFLNVRKNSRFVSYHMYWNGYRFDVPNNYFSSSRKSTFMVWWVVGSSSLIMLKSFWFASN